MENQNKSEIISPKAHDVWICLFVLFLFLFWEAMKPDAKAEEEKCSYLL